MAVWAYDKAHECRDPARIRLAEWINHRNAVYRMLTVSSIDQETCFLKTFLILGGCEINQLWRCGVLYSDCIKRSYNHSITVLMKEITKFCSWWDAVYCSLKWTYTTKAPHETIDSRCAFNSFSREEPKARLRISVMSMDMFLGESLFSKATFSVLLAITTSYLITWLNWWFTSWQSWRAIRAAKRTAPGEKRPPTLPSKIPIVGHIFSFLRDGHGFMSKAT